MKYFLCGLTLIFIYLKMTDQIDWSWWWVLSPFWISWLIAIPFLLILAAYK